ncbi:hypothetical protein F5Y15DRAFT_54756 [Xylariaceae sp. FL0016]|nr:hypothetical protein F5Y15DRAFT_54756 [Xylariaceae sp. FL0016]
MPSFLLKAMALASMAIVGTSAQAGSSGLTVSTILQTLPSCALPCVLTGVQSASCSMTDIELLTDCMCTNITLQSDLSTCVQTSCGFDNQVLAVNLQSALCASYPKQSRSHEILTAAALTLCLSIPIVIARGAARIHLTKQLWWDDWMCLIAEIFLLAIACIEIASAKLGFGLHYWNVDVENATSLLKFFYAAQIFYILVQVFAKVSILMLYARIFPTRWFQWTIKGCITFMLGHGAIFVFVIIFQCVPVAAVWERNISGRCLDVNSVGWAGAIMSVIEDIVLVLLPLPELWKLQVIGRKRVGVALMLAVGSFATITSMVRLKYLVQFSTTYDTTWDNTDVIVWSLIELLCAIICGCLPPLRPWLNPLIPRIAVTWARTTTGRSGSRPGGNSTGESSTYYGSKAFSDSQKKNASYPLAPISPDGGGWKELPKDTSMPRVPGRAASRSTRRLDYMDFEQPNLPGHAYPMEHDNSSSSETDLIIQDHSGVQVTYDIRISQERRRGPDNDLGLVSSVSADSQPRADDDPPMPMSRREGERKASAVSITRYGRRDSIDSLSTPRRTLSRGRVRDV